MFVVAVGNPFDGVRLFGPFEEDEEFENSVEDADWWFIEVYSREEFYGESYNG